MEKFIDLDSLIRQTISTDYYQKILSGYHLEEEHISQLLYQSKAQIEIPLSSELEELKQIQEEIINKTRQELVRTSPIKFLIQIEKVGSILFPIGFIFLIIQLFRYKNIKLYFDNSIWTNLKNWSFYLDFSFLFIATFILILFGFSWYLNKNKINNEKKSISNDIRNQSKLEELKQQRIQILKNEKIPELIRENFNLIVNKIKPEVLSKNFSALSINGLSEVYNSSFQINTNSYKDLIELIKRMPGGCIGISGPRGIGKSTLMKSFINISGSTLREKEVMTIYTSAPVNYEQRDFTIYVFLEIINKYLSLKGRKNEEFVIEDEAIERRSPLIKIYELKEFLLPVSLVGLGIGFVQSMLIHTKSDSQINSQRYIDFFNFLSIFVSNHLTAFSLLIIASFLFLEHLNFRGKFKLNPYRLEIGTVLEEKAIYWKRRLKFQQSYTTGWSGSLNTPVGISTKLSEAYSYAENQLSIPEITEGLKDFISEISNEYLVVICIDELDKQEAESTVVSFLNQTKSLFGINNCYYLLSVSENAINRFEERGIQFRDAFDSTFDEIVYLDYLDLNDTIKLINKRVIGMPFGFKAFAFIISGGLPRETLRTIRKISSISELKGLSDLDNLIKEFIIIEFSNKIRILNTKSRMGNFGCSIKLLNELSNIPQLADIQDIKSSIGKLESISSESEKLEDKIYLSRIINYFHLLFDIKDFYEGQVDIENSKNQIVKIKTLANRRNKILLFQE